MSCSNKTKSKETLTTTEKKAYLIAVLDTIWTTEQTPIRLRDSLGRIYGYESIQFREMQELCDKNHFANEKRILEILDNYGWPSNDIIQEQGNLTICNVLQHSDILVRIKYLPLMRNAVIEKGLQPRLLARAEDRIATDRGELQTYGGQIKYYPKTKSFDVWPIKDPENVDKRRAAIGLIPIAEFLNNLRTPLEWNLKEQIRRTADFELERKKKVK